MRWLFPCTFPNFSQHKMQHHPPATVTAAQHISGASLNFPSCIRTYPKLFTAMSVSRCSGPRRRSVASRSRRSSGSASAKAPRASSTSASLGRGAPREPKSFPRLRQKKGHFFHYLWCRGKSLVGKQNSVFQIVLISLEQLLQAILYWCYLMLVVNTVAYCNLRLSLLQLCGISGCKSAVTRQYSSWLNNTCLRMCLSLWRDWGPHRCSAWSAKRSSGPNLSAVASARHRSLGPWWCLSHGCAYHMAMQWSTMSPTWKTNQVQENGQRYAKSSRCGTAPGFSQKLATGLQSMVPALRDLQPYVFTREGGGGQVFWNWQTFVLNGAGNSSQLIA